MEAAPADPRDARLWQLLWLGLGLAAVWPLWWVEYPPIQDLPQHLAAIRVLHDYDAERYAFARHFVIDLMRTQYLAYYLAVDLMAYVLDVELANRVLMSAFVIGTPLAARELLSSLGRDPRLALLLFPVTYNAHLILGFLNFIAAIPLCLWGLSLAVKQRRSPRPGRAVGLSLLCVLCFYTHVVPFGLMALGIGLIALGRDPRRVARAAAPLLPAAACALIWMLDSPAGHATLTAARGASSGPKPQFEPFERALHDTPRWLTDVLAGDADRLLLWALLGLMGVSALIGLATLRRSAPLDALGRQLSLRLALLSPLCLLLYFVSPTSYDWIWPIAQRFPLLAIVFAVLLVPPLPRPVTSAVAACAILLSAAHFHFAGNAFGKFQREEVGDFDAALDAIPPGQRVAGLIFARGSRHVAFSPFIHYVAYYQAKKGGAVMFTFADFPQSPFRFRSGDRPPPVPPRWEWKPQDVRLPELAWYDYVLVRGGPGLIARARDRYQPLHRSARWSVWKRIRQRAEPPR